jgi:hypothetical protein
MRPLRSSVLSCVLAAAAGALGCGARSDIGSMCPNSVGTRVGASCGGGRAPALSGVVSTAPALDLFTARCGIVYVVVAGGPFRVAIRASFDGGESFGPPNLVPAGVEEPDHAEPVTTPIAADLDGTLYATAASSGAVSVYRSDDGGSVWHGPFTVGPGQPRPGNGPSVVANGDQVAVYWIDEAGGTLRVARSTDRGETFPAPPAEEDAPSFASWARLCLAGERGLLGTWIGCDGGSCANSAMQFGPAGLLGAWSFGGDLSIVDLGPGDAPALACAADGRGTIAWPVESDDFLSESMVVAPLIACGGIGSPLTVVAHTDAFYPSVVLGPKGALLTWLGGGYVTLGLDGAPSGTLHERPDFSGDGNPSVIQSACAWPDGRYLLISAAERTLGATRAIATVLAEDGSVVESHDLGTLMIDGNNGCAWAACDESGRAHLLWTSADDQAHYTTIDAP